MKNTLMILLLAVVLVSCNNIPNKSIFEPLTMKELGSIIKKDTLFEDFYRKQQATAAKFGEIDKARYSDVTYRSLYKMMQFVQDSTQITPLYKNAMKEWNNKFGSYHAKVDSVLNYWSDYKQDNSLDNYVKIEFKEIDKEYYSYNHGVKNVNLGFTLTPLQGEIEQVKFNYRYSAKINDIFGDKHNCISTAPFSKPVVRYWEVGYSDEKTLKNTTTDSFVRDYDIEIEVTHVRKDGNNYRIEDLNIPRSVTNVFETDSVRSPYLYSSYKEDIIKELLNTDYIKDYQFVENKVKEVLEEKFPSEFAYMEFATKK